MRWQNIAPVCRAWTTFPQFVRLELNKKKEKRIFSAKFETVRLEIWRFQDLGQVGFEVREDFFKIYDRRLLVLKIIFRSGFMRGEGGKGQK